MHSILSAVCYVRSQAARNFVTSLRGSIVSPKLEQFVLKLDNLYSNLIAQDSLSQSWTPCFKISQLVSKLDSLSQNQTACVKVRQCVSNSNSVSQR